MKPHFAMSLIVVAGFGSVLASSTAAGQVCQPSCDIGPLHISVGPDGISAGPDGSGSSCGGDSGVPDAAQEAREAQDPPLAAWLLEQM